MEWIEVVSPEGVVLPSDPVLLSLQTITGLKEVVCDSLETSGRVRLVAQPGSVSPDRVTSPKAKAAIEISSDQR